jgi:hypothetical protein
MPRSALCLFAALALLTPRFARAVDVSPPAFLQWFDGSYATIENRTADVWAAGYGQLWLPPPGRAESSNFSVGYDVYDRFDLGQPGNPTLYGTETGLKRLARVMHRAGGDLYVDFVANHNGFSDLGTPGFPASGGYPGFVLTAPGVVDGDFHSAFASGDLNGRLSGLVDIDHAQNLQYVRHPVPGFAGNIPAGTTASNGRLANVPDEDNRRFYPDRQQQPILVFDPTTGQSNIAIYPFNTADPMAGDPVSENATGLLMRYAQWMVQSVGVDGFRIDAAKHMEPWVLDYIDRAVYRASTRSHLDGSRRDVFSFSEVFDGNREYLRSFVRKDINPNDPGRVGGNRDVLDFAQFFAFQSNLTSNGLQNDWRNVVNAGLDVHDDGRHNGSNGVMFVQSHDSFGPALNNVAHAYTLMHPGNAVVYFNGKEFGDGRDFPKDGRGDALGGLYGDGLARLVEIRNTHGRGNFRERRLEKEIYVYERSNSALVVLSNRLDNHYSQRTVDVDFPWGTYLVELTGNAEGDANIPKVLQVFNEEFEGQSKVNITVKPNNGGDRGYLIYGLATPQAPAGLQLTSVSQVLSDPNPTASTNGTRRLADLHVISAGSFTVSLQTAEVNLLGLIRDRDADGDNALIKLDGGRDVNGNGQVDFRTPGGVTYGFENFTTKHSDLYGGGDGEFRQTISTVGLSEGVHFLEAIAFRHRDDGGPAVYSSFKKVIYVDRLPPESVLDGFAPIAAGMNENRRAAVRSVDQTADSVHVFLDLPAALSDDDVRAMVGSANRASQIDRDLFTRDFGGLTSGNHVLTVVSFEPTGNHGVLRMPGQLTSTIYGAGLGDVDHNGQYEPADVTAFETVLYSQNEQFASAADLNGDGLVDNADLFALGGQFAAAGAGQAVHDALRAALLRRGDVDASGATDAADIDYLRSHIGGEATWLLDLDGDGLLSDADEQVLIGTIFSTVPGDANLDGRVDATDAAMLAGGFGGFGGWAVGDFDGDGRSTLYDAAVLQTRLGFVATGLPTLSAAAHAPVPEPAAWLIAVSAALALTRARRRRR